MARISPLCLRNARSRDSPRWTRAVRGSSEPSFDVYEQAWKDHQWSLAAALPGKGRVLGEEFVLADSGWAGEIPPELDG